MVEFMAKLRKEITVGVVGGSDLPKQKEQLGESGEFLSSLAWYRTAKRYKSCVGARSAHTRFVSSQPVTGSSPNSDNKLNRSGIHISENCCVSGG